MKKLINKFLSHNYFKYILILTSIVFIYLFFQDNEKIIKIISNVEYKRIISLVFFSIFLIFIYSHLTLTCLKKVCGIQINTRQWYLIYFNSQFLSSIPFFGILYRARQLKKFNLNYDKFVGIYILISWFYLFFSLIFISLESYVFFGETSLFNIKLYLIFLISSILVFFIPLATGFIINKYISYFKVENNFFLSRFQKLIQLFILNIFNYKIVRSFLVIILFIHILEFIVISELIQTLENNINFTQTFFIFFGTQLIDSLNLVPQNLIISDISYGILTDKLNYDFELGVLIKIYMRFIIFFSSISMAILYNIYLKLINYKYNP